MKSLARLLSLFLAVLVAWTPVVLQAEMIGTDRVATTQAHADSVGRFLQSPQVVAQLESLGVPADAARERVASMTPQELAELAGKIDSLPVGADSTLSLAGSSWLIAAIIVLIGFIVWSTYYRNR